MYINKRPDSQKNALANQPSHEKTDRQTKSLEFVDNRAAADQVRLVQKIADDSPLSMKLKNSFPVAQSSNRPATVQRILDESFDHGGVPTAADTATCKAFARRVSHFVDQAYNELLSGNVSAWEGAKFASFAKLLMEDNPYAVPHVGNAVEERVYALMNATDMGAKWTPQFSEGMGSVSRPDIVINLPSGREGLVDITSDRFHILKKGGAWTTSARYVYVAEAWFPSVTDDDMPNIKAAFRKGGVSLASALAAKAEADEARKARQAARKAEMAEALEIFKSYGSTAAVVREGFKGDRAEALSWMRQSGLGHKKGVPRLKGKRKMSEDTRRKKKSLARARRAHAVGAAEMQVREAIVNLREHRGSNPSQILAYIQANKDPEKTIFEVRAALGRGVSKGLWEKVRGGTYRLIT